MIRTGISTSEAVAEALTEKGTPLSFGATAESWREVFTTISGEDETITPRETEGVTGWESTNETALKTFNTEVSGLKLISATSIDASQAKPTDNPGIAENDGKYEVTKEGNTITVVDKGIIPYVGGNIDTPKKWVGMLVDFGVKVQGTTYNIENIDYTDAARWGGQTETTFVMWLTTEKAGDYVFKDVEDESNECTLTVAFEETNEEPKEEETEEEKGVELKLHFMANNEDVTTTVTNVVATGDKEVAFTLNEDVWEAEVEAGAYTISYSYNGNDYTIESATYDSNTEDIVEIEVVENGEE